MNPYDPFLMTAGMYGQLAYSIAESLRGQRRHQRVRGIYGPSGVRYRNRKMVLRTTKSRTRRGLYSQGTAKMTVTWKMDNKAYLVEAKEIPYKRGPFFLGVLPNSSLPQIGDFVAANNNRYPIIEVDEQRRVVIIDIPENS